jgi:large repetitive protein
VLANDTDPNGDPMAVDTWMQTSDHGTITQNADGTLHYVPDPWFRGPDSFTYTAKDACGATSGTGLGVVSVTVTPVNHAPVAFNDVHQHWQRTDAVIEYGRR